MSPFKNPEDTGKIEGVRTWMTRSMPERIHWRLSVVAKKRRTTMERIVNEALEIALPIIEGGKHV